MNVNVREFVEYLFFFLLVNVRELQFLSRVCLVVYIIMYIIYIVRCNREQTATKML
jgi:hypothetical protein